MGDDSEDGWIHEEKKERMEASNGLSYGNGMGGCTVVLLFATHDYILT